MIIRIKKRDLLILVTSLIFISLIPLIYSADITAAQSGTIAVWLTISNQVPVNVSISNITAFNIDPTSGGSSQIIIEFNATDPDGVEDINGTNGGRVVVNLTLANSQFRTQDSCQNVTDAANGLVRFTCIINMKYYDNASTAWVVNISVYDKDNAKTINDSATFTYHVLAAFDLKARGVSESASLNFSGMTIGAINQVPKAPILLNNTGNDDFDQINITGANLILTTDSSKIIPITLFRINVTNSSTGGGMPLTTAAQVIPAGDGMLGGSGGNVANATLMHGPASTGDTSAPYPLQTLEGKGNQTLLFFVNVPGGTTTGIYNNTWNITVVDID